MIHLLVLLLAVLLAAAISVCVVLYIRLQRKEAIQEKADDLSASLPTAAIDQFLYDRCCRYMTEHRPFLVPKFTLQDLANAVYTNKVYLSKTINRYSGKNFRQYVNYYRVMYAMELYRNNMSLRISDLSQLSGFHSTTSFFQSFKNVMGEPPSHWCSRVRRKYLKAEKE